MKGLERKLEHYSSIYRPAFGLRAIYSGDPKPFAEYLGTYASEADAQDAKALFERQDNAPNFLGCEILYLGEVLE